MDDRFLTRSGARFNGLGVRLLGGGVVVVIVGVVLDVIHAMRWLDVLGTVLIWIGGVVAVVGLVLLIVGVTTNRLGQHKPFA